MARSGRRSSEARHAAEAAAGRVERLQRVTRRLAGSSIARCKSPTSSSARAGRRSEPAAPLIALSHDEQLSIIASDGYDASADRAVRLMPLSRRCHSLLARLVSRQAVWLAGIRAAPQMTSTMT